MPKRILSGVVVSRTDKTVIVRVVRLLKNTLYKKSINRSKKYAAHDESNQASVGDRVSIQESRPYSKTKKWKLIEAQSVLKQIQIGISQS